MATNKQQIAKIKDYANCADVSYAKLHYVYENKDFIFSSKTWKASDNIRFGDKTKEGRRFILNNREIPKNSNTAYARCVEAHFMQDVVLEKGVFKDTTIDNNPNNIPINSTLSFRTKNFVNRYELVEHQPNTDYRFSATLFKDTKADSKDSQYIFAIRGTEIGYDDLSIDITLARNNVPIQCYELARFYEEQVKKHLDYQQKIVITGHSLGGYLVQSFCFMHPERVAELYTYNSLGLLGAWNKDFVDSLLESLKLVAYTLGGAGIAKK